MLHVHMNFSNIHIFLKKWQVNVLSEELQRSEHFCVLPTSVFLRIFVDYFQYIILYILNQFFMIRRPSNWKTT